MKVKRLTACILAGAMALSIALTGCGKIDANAVGATLNGEEISLGFMNFMARFQQAMGDASYIAYFGTGVWSMEVEEGKTLEASTKESVVESIKTMYLLEDHMEDYGVKITDEELSAMDTAAKKFMSDNSKKAIKQMGATEEYVKEMLRLYTIQQKMQDAIFDASDATVTDEEAAQRTYSYFRVSATKASDGTTDLTDEEKEKLASDMKDVAAAAKEDFEKAAKDKEYTVSKTSYGSDTTVDEKLIEAADALKEGEVSDLIMDSDEANYYVLRLDKEFDEEATAEKKESMLNTKKQEEFKSICDGYIEKAEFELNEEQWAKVKFNRLFGVVSEEDKK